MFIDCLGLRWADVIAEKRSVINERKQLLAKIKKLNDKERSLVNKYLENKLTEEIYETIREEISSERINCKARLEAGEGTLQAAIRVLEQAIVFARDLPKAYKRALDPIKRPNLLSIVFKEVLVKDGGLYRATLNAPLDYLCKTFEPNRKNATILFDSVSSGEPSRDATNEYIAR